MCPGDVFSLCTALCAPAPEYADEEAEPMVVSIVSHGHAAEVQRLLGEMAKVSCASVTRVVLTQNIPEAAPVAPRGGWPFQFELLRNPVAMGFGANHNQALRGAQERLVCVLNPDVGLGGRDPFAELKRVALEAQCGCAYPEQVDDSGEPADFERVLPTPGALWARRVMLRNEKRVDWVNAACLVLPRSAWEVTGGFDTNYFMYCEDVDLSIRLRLAGFPLKRASARVIHTGRRASSRQIRHLFWHVQSFLRLWRSPAYRAAQQTVTEQAGSKVTIDPS